MAQAGDGLGHVSSPSLLLSGIPGQGQLSQGLDALVEQVLAVVERQTPAQGRAQRFGHQLQGLDVVFREGVWTGIEGLQHADRAILFQQWRADHRANPDDAAGRTIDPAVGFAIGAVQHFSPLDTETGKTV